jgi:hypothetical protein
MNKDTAYNNLIVDLHKPATLKMSRHDLPVSSIFSVSIDCSVADPNLVGSGTFFLSRSEIKWNDKSSHRHNILNFIFDFLHLNFFMHNK